LVAITPAAGAVGVGGAIAIGILVSIICFIMVSVVKHKLGYDDSLDAFGVHGVGGIIGAILTGVFATKAVTGLYLPDGGVDGALYGNGGQLLTQLIAVGSTILYSGVLTFVLFKITDKLVGIRATENEEVAGLDITQHNEMAYTEAE
jgi:Amt family ammonium transporter